jgi:hypothetical protein
LESFENVPIHSEQNVPFGLLVPCLPRRNNIRNKEVEHLAIVKFTECKKGITFEDLTLKFGISKKQSQRKLKECRKRKALFTPEKHKPQAFYPTSLRADVIEYLYNNRRNVPVQPTGVTSCNIPLSNIHESDKAQSFLDVLCAFDNNATPIHIHKLQLELFINPQGYEDLIRDSLKGNKAKPHEERIGKAYVKYFIYPKGKVMVYIACSNNPFKLETEADETLLFAFFGQVRDRLLYFLSDVRERIVPSIMSWRLIQCDINRDVEVNDRMQLTLPDIQLMYADQVFRIYVKSLHNIVVARCEESFTLKSPLIGAVNKIRNPNNMLENKFDVMITLTNQLRQEVDSILNCKTVGYSDINN